MLRHHRRLRLRIASLMSPVDSLLVGRPAGQAICHGLIGTLRQCRLSDALLIRWQISRPTRNDTFATPNVAKGARSCRLSLLGRSAAGRSSGRPNLLPWLVVASRIGARSGALGKVARSKLTWYDVGMRPFASLVDRTSRRTARNRVRTPVSGRPPHTT